MSPSQSSQYSWASSPDWAARQLDGGPRSFPRTRDMGFLRSYAYTAPTELYQKLFFRKSVCPSSEPSSYRSAGWLIPDDTVECNPVFVAHSILSAIWLLRETLPKNTLAEAVWEDLARAAYLLGQDTEHETPPSAQKPRDSLSSSLPKRSAPAAQTSPAKRARMESGSDNSGASNPTSPQPESSLPRASSEDRGPPSEAADAEGEPSRTVTVTNNNRRHERMREAKQKKQALERRQSLGLMAPREGAPRAEHIAYASVETENEHIVSWLFKQPIDDSDFFSAVKSPYVTAISMLENAHALGNQSAQYHAASFLQSWRSRGTPFPTHVAPRSSTPVSRTSSGLVRVGVPWLHDSSLSQRSAVDSAFRHAWHTVDHYEGQLAAVHIQYRWAMAFLGRAYTDKVALLEQEDQIAGRGRRRNRNGRGNLRTEARTALLPLVYDKATDKEKTIFKRRLHRAIRWHEAANRLGWGSLCLMPHGVITNTWVEQTLRVGEWRVWLELVQKVNPDAYAASRALDSWLGSESIAGGPIDGKQILRIEKELPATVYEVEEMQDSDEDGDLAPTQSQAVELSAGPPRALRQLTLPELFEPQ